MTSSVPGDPSGPLWVRSRAWESRREDEVLVLARKDGAARLRLDGDGATVVEAMLERARVPTPRAAMLEGFADWGDEATALITDLVNKAVLRRFDEAPRVKVKGRSTAGRSLQKTAKRTGGGWSVGREAPFHVLELRQLLVATRGCLTCYELRLQRSVGTPGDIPPHVREVREELFLIELSRAPLKPAEALTLMGDQARRAVVPPHPDCPKCSPLPSVADQHRVLREVFQREPRPIVDRMVMLAPPTAALQIFEEHTHVADYPYGAPFVWGRIALTRKVGKQTFDLSTASGLYGKGPDAQTCRRMAFSEGMERLGCLTQRPATWGTATRLKNAVRPTELFSFATADDDRRRRAFSATLELTEDREALVPFEALAVSYPAEAYPDALVRETFYSGAASHLTLADAAVHATLELLERDAFLISWYRKRALPRLLWPTQPSERTTLFREYFETRGMHLELFDLTLQFPIPMLVLRVTARAQRGNWPKDGAMIFASSGFTAISALERVLSLAAGQFINFAVASDSKKDPLNAAVVEETSRTQPGWRLLARYLDPRHAAAHHFLGSSEKPFEDVRPSPAGLHASDHVAFLRREFQQAGLRWYVARLSDVNTERAGLEVAKICIPGLLRLASTREGVDLGLERLHRDWPGATVDAPSADPHPLY